MPISTIQWIGRKVRIIDQLQLPEKLVYLDIDDFKVLGEAIQKLRIRGAPAIGIAGAMGVALAAHQYENKNRKSYIENLRKAIAYLRSTRPTAVNLFWALERMRRVMDSSREESVSKIKVRLVEEALAILEEDRHVCRQIGQHGAHLLPQEAAVLTHCNAGALATADYGTALGVIYAAVDMGKRIKVYVDETRPLLQGSRLTAWELQQSGIDVTLICDSSAGYLMKQGRVHCVLVGADRIAGNGDTANKIGTYTLAVLAKKHSIPFYVAAPVSTFDLSIPSGDGIPIEERAAKEVIFGFGSRIGPENVDVYNPAFDVTPHNLITAFVTERGILYPSYNKSMKKVQNVKNRIFLP